MQLKQANSNNILTEEELDVEGENTISKQSSRSPSILKSDTFAPVPKACSRTPSRSPSLLTHSNSSSVTPNKKHYTSNLYTTHSNAGSATPRNPIYFSMSSSRNSSKLNSRDNSSNSSVSSSNANSLNPSESSNLTGILKVTTQPLAEYIVDHSIQTLENDDIAQSMLENRSITDSMLIGDDAEVERQQRLYTMLRTSSKYKRLQVRYFN